MAPFWMAESPNGAFTGLVIEQIQEKIHGKSKLFNNGILIFMVFEIIPIWLGQLFSPRTSEVIHFCPLPRKQRGDSESLFFGILSPWFSSAPREFRASVSRMSNQPTHKSTNHLGDLKQPTQSETLWLQRPPPWLRGFRNACQKSPQIDLLNIISTIIYNGVLQCPHNWVI